MKSPSIEPLDLRRLKVTTQEWIELWRYWDRATDFSASADAVDHYNEYAKNLVQKYNIKLEPDQVVEFT